MTEAKRQPPRLVNRVYLSISIAGIARRAYEAAEEQSPPKNGITVIIISWAAFEGFVNEVIFDAKRSISVRESRNMPITQSLREFAEFCGTVNEKTSIEDKVRASVELLGSDRYDRNKLPYRDLYFLKDIRNSLVHVETEGFAYTKDGSLWTERRDLINGLFARKIINNKIIPFTFIIGTNEIGKWALNTVSEMVTHIIGMSKRAGLEVELESDYLEAFKPVDAIGPQS